MGLDAAVFKRETRLRQDFPSLEFRVHPESGEPIFEGEQDLSLDELTAVNIRIGNLGMVCELRGAITPVLPADSIVLTRVLHRASHSGYLGRALLPLLAEELRVLHGLENAYVKEFVQKMESLLAAAGEEGTTISFW